MILILYHVLILVIGYWISRSLLRYKIDTFVVGITTIVIGLLISVPITYLLSVIFHSISAGVYVFIVGAIVPIWFIQKRIFIVEGKRLPLTETAFSIFCLIFSSYIMIKTLKEAGNGTISVARNTVFDFGHSLSIVRSMSWGDNLPYTSPFVSGTEHLYHFMFHFWAAILEHFGVPISVAINIPSIIGFFCLLMVVYILGKEIFKQKLIGILSVLFLMFHGGFMFIPFFQQHGVSVWGILQHSNYLFTGPFDGTSYSLFLTLNVFVNQRHLGISLAIFFLLYFMFTRDVKRLEIKHVVMYAMLLGMFTLWHLILALGLLFAMCIFLGLEKKWKESIVFISSSLFISLTFIHPWISSIGRGIKGLLERNETGGIGHEVSPFLLLEFILLNFGLSLIFIITGMVRRKKECREFLPLIALIVLFTAVSIPTGIIDQKFLNVLQVIVALFTAVGIYILLKMITIIRAITIIVMPFLILSGIIDFMVIKNDFMFPVEETRDGKLVSFIHKNTEKEAVFLAYEEIFDPITLAGRRNYYGFFKQPDIFLEESDKHRKDRIENVFSAQDEETLMFAVQDIGVNYILLNKTKRENFPYTINYDLIKETFPVILEDSNHLLLDV